jgi:hypothetical protein
VELMRDLSRYLFLAGALPFVLLGAAHALATPRRPDGASGLSPSDPQLSRLMSQTHIRLTRRTDMWLAWVGFNYSHSLGLVLLGGLVVLVGRSEPSFAAGAPVFVPFAFLASAIYLVLAIQYWFRTPILGCCLSCVLFLCSWILLRMGGQ